MNAGSSEELSPSASSVLRLVKRGGRRRSLLCAGSEAEEDEEDAEALEDGDESGSARGERVAGV
jgi:hypothetical protein